MNWDELLEKEERYHESEEFPESDSYLKMIVSIKYYSIQKDFQYVSVVSAHESGSLYSVYVYLL